MMFTTVNILRFRRIFKDITKRMLFRPGNGGEKNLPDVVKNCWIM